MHSLPFVSRAEGEMNRSEWTRLFAILSEKKNEEAGRKTIIGLFCSFINEGRFPFMHRTETIVDIMTKVIDKRSLRLTESSRTQEREENLSLEPMPDQIKQKSRRTLTTLNDRLDFKSGMKDNDV